jgi:hypothetical protein
MTSLEPKNRPSINSILTEPYFLNEDLNRISLVLDIEKLNGSSLSNFDLPLRKETAKVNNTNRASILSEEVRFSHIDIFFIENKLFQNHNQF